MMGCCSVRKKGELRAVYERPVFEDTIYEDEFVKVTSKTLTIHSYWFPSANAKRIPLTELKEIDISPESVESSLNANNWGMGLGDIWWAQDSRSHRMQYAVVVRSSAAFRHGFSCRDRNAALDSIKRALTAANAFDSVICKG